MRKVSVSTPASTANLGAGFDCLGLALNLRNVVELWDTGRGSGLEIDVEGEGEDRLPTDDSNLVYRAAERVFARLGKRPSGLLRLHAVNAVPLGSGMGSSAASVVGGLVAANALVEGGLTRDEILRLAYEMEGHPDNAAAALYGGLTLVSASGDELMARAVAVPPMRVVIVLPELRLSTAEGARPCRSRCRWPTRSTTWATPCSRCRPWLPAMRPCWAGPWATGCTSPTASA